MGLVTYWPLFAFIIGLFLSGLVTAVGLTMWVMGRLTEQDAKRIEVKEAVLKEIREGNRAIFDKIDILNNRVGELANRVTKLEVQVENLKH